MCGLVRGPASVMTVLWCYLVSVQRAVYLPVWEHPVTIHRRKNKGPTLYILAAVRVWGWEVWMKYWGGRGGSDISPSNTRKPENEIQIFDSVLCRKYLLSKYRILWNILNKSQIPWCNTTVNVLVCCPDICRRERGEKCVTVTKKINQSAGNIQLVTNWNSSDSKYGKGPFDSSYELSIKCRVQW